MLFLFIILSSIRALPQKYLHLETWDVDSLHLILPHQNGEQRVNSLNNLAVSLSFVDYNESKQYADDAMNLAKEVNYEEGIAAAFRNYGQIYLYQGNYPQALNNYLEALSLYEKLEKKHTAGWVCFEIAKTHYFANNYEKTIEYAFIALDLFQERTDEGYTVGNARDFVAVYGGIVETYGMMGRYDKTLEFDLKVYDLVRKNNFYDIELMISTWSLGYSFSDEGEPDSAKAYFLKALAFPDESLDMKTLKFRNIISLGWLYYSAGVIDSALYYMKTAFEFYEKKGFLYWALVTSRGLGYIYYKNNELTVAEKYLKQSERIFNEMLTKNSWFRNDSLKYIASYGLELYFPVPPARLKEMMWAESRSMYKLLYRINNAENNFDKALKYHVAYAGARDTLNNIMRNRETIELQTRYESERKDQQIEALSLANELKESRLQQNRSFLFGSAGLFILILMLGYILFRQNKLKTDQQMLVLQQKLFRSQMNPHFIFNSLASIQNFIVKQDSRKANIFLSRFSELIRRILDNSTQEYITFEKEISTIENYLELQKVRYIEKFDYSMEVDEAIDTETMKIPPMLAQPIIENAIEHGIKHKDSKGNIHIRFTLQDNRIIFEVEDDGVGREKAQEILFKHDKDHKSLATAITLERIRVLNKKSKKKISFKILDLKNENNKPIGTRVTFEIPVVFS